MMGQDLRLSQLHAAAPGRSQLVAAANADNRMQRDGVVPDAVIYNTLLSACGKSGEPERALEVFDRMQCEGVVRSVVTCSAFMVFIVFIAFIGGARIWVGGERVRRS